MSTISCQKLTKKYGDLQVVHGFDLEVKDEEFIVFLGPSGCGKSTILRMLAGLEDITSGKLEIGGKDVTTAEPGERGVAMVFQNYALYPHMTVRKNIAFGLRRSGLTTAQIDQKIHDVVTMLALQPYLDRKPAQMSGGQQQRVAIARAIVKTPEVFLFDEPLSNLDAKLRHQLRVEIAKLHKQLKTTTVFVTHDQMEAMTLADRIVLMNDGTAEQIGTPEEIYTKPKTLFVADFIGTPSMNFLKADISGASAKLDIGTFDISGADFSQPSTGKATIGIRPQNIGLARANDSDLALQGTVVFTEYMGNDVLLVVDCAGVEISAVVPAANLVAEGTVISVYLSQEFLHIFDDASGLRLNNDF
jgi:multiple sugar transport system ATP-binding protein